MNLITRKVKFSITKASKGRTGLILLFSIFFILRLYHLGFCDFWYDEIGTIWYAKIPWFTWNPPLYWILLHFWTIFFGFSELSLRFPSLIFSFSSCVLIFILGKDLFNKKTGLVASILMGISPFQLWYAQEARSYSMLLFLSLLSNYLFFKAIERRGKKLWLYFILVSSIGLYTNYFFIFLVLSQLLYILVFGKLTFRKLVFFLLIPFCFLPYLNRFLTKLLAVKSGFWVPSPHISSLLVTVENLILGYNAITPLYILADIAAFILLTGIFLNPKRGFQKNVNLCLFFFLVPIISAFLFSKIFFSVYLDRGLIFVSPYLYLMLSYGIVSLKNRIVRDAILIIMVFSFVFSIYAYYKNKMFMPLSHHIGVHLKKPVKPIVKLIIDDIGQNDVVAFTNESIIPPFWFYAKNKKPFYFLFVPGKAFVAFSLKPIHRNKYTVPVEDVKNLNFDRLWVVSCDWERDGKLDDNSKSVKNSMDKNFKLEFMKEFDGLWVFRYVKE